MDITADLAPTGVLRAAINLGNPVLAQGSPDAPGGVTVDIARELGARLGLPVELVCFDAARDSFEAMQQGRADLCFLAVDPAREATVAFTAPYAVIEAVYVVRADSPLTTASAVDRPGVRVGVKRGSAYDLHLSRTLTRAEVVRGTDGTTVFAEEGLEVGAGIRQPVVDHVADHPGHRLLEPPFMQIHQAVGTTRSRSDETVAFLHAFVEELKADGFVADALRRSGRRDAEVAPPASRSSKEEDAVTHSFDRAYWDEHWQQGPGGVGRALPANPYLAREVGGLTPGTALDAGCGEGAEAIWLAAAGWQVTAADIAPSALARAAERAGDAGVAERVRWVEADLGTWQPDAAYDLVTTHYAHPTIPQLAFYDRLATWVAPGGTLLVVGHLDTAEETGHGHHPPAEASVTAADISARLDDARWVVVTAEEGTRTLTDHAGRSVELQDVVVRADRRS